MTRPTLNELRERVGLPTAPPPRNTNKPCATCADAAGGLGYSDGSFAVFCGISRERMRLYPIIRSLTPRETAIMPCWRPR